MGATPPAIARWVGSTPSGVSWLGVLYGGNIAGAVAGCLLAGLGLNRHEKDTICRQVMFQLAEFPENLFVGSPEAITRLRRSLDLLAP